MTIDLHINYLSPADGTALVARARAIQLGKTVCVASVEIATTGDTAERLCAIATATMRVVDLPPASAG